MEGSGAEILTMLFPGLRKTRWWSIYKQGKIGGGTGEREEEKSEIDGTFLFDFTPENMSCTYYINELKMTYFKCSESNSVGADLKKNLPPLWREALIKDQARWTTAVFLIVLESSDCDQTQQRPPYSQPSYNSIFTIAQSPSSQPSVTAPRKWDGENRQWC